jgi:Tol biopolymer transport system component
MKRVVVALAFAVVAVLPGSAPAEAPVGTIERIGSGFYNVALSGDGRFVAFSSDDPGLVSNDNNGITDVFVHDRLTGSTSIVSKDSTGNQANGFSAFPSISSDGRYVAFESDAHNLAGVLYGVHRQSYVHDRENGVTELISADVNGMAGDGNSLEASVNGDGRFVAFASDAPLLTTVNGEYSGASNIVIKDRLSGSIEVVSKSHDGGAANNASMDPVVNADGRFIAFTSGASNLVSTDTNPGLDIFVRDRQTNTTELISVSTAGIQGNGTFGEPSMSPDGRFVAFSYHGAGFAGSDPGTVRGNVFVRDRLNGTTEWVSVDQDGGDPDSHSGSPAISYDGRYVAFRGFASDLVPDDTNVCVYIGPPMSCHDVFVRDLHNETTIRINLDPSGNQVNDYSLGWFQPAISYSGAQVAFTSQASLTGDANYWSAAFVWEAHDADVDSEWDRFDNCPTVPNPEQVDADGDGRGNACDNCPQTPNPAQTDTDSDEMGDACDPDDDADGVTDESDNCPLVMNAEGQADDIDGDLAGDACDGPGSGNVDCSGPLFGASSVDALKILRHSAALSVAQSEPCLDLGLARQLAPPANWKMGDVDCSGTVNSIDALKVLRAVAGLSVAKPVGCPEVKPP